MLEHVSVTGGQGFMDVIQLTRVFLQEQRSDFLEQLEISADSGERGRAIQNLFL